MSDMEKRVHDAFDAVHAPERVKASTLAAIEAKRAELAASEGRTLASSTAPGVIDSDVAAGNARNDASIPLAGRPSQIESASFARSAAGSACWEPRSP